MPATLQTINGLQVATLNGPLDSTSGADLVTIIRSSVENTSRVVLDFARVPQVDPPGLRHLLQLNQWLQQAQGRLALAAASPEVRRTMDESSITDKFEFFPSREMALKALGGNAPADDFSTFDTDSGVIPQVDSAIFSDVPKASSSPTLNDWVPPAPTAGQAAPWSNDAEDDGWNKYTRQSSVAATESPDKKPSKKWLYPSLAVAALVVLASIYCLVNFLKVPEIRVAETMLVVQEGQELPETSILVVNGALDFDEIGLPSGISFTDSEETPAGLQYYLTGVPKTAGRNIIRLHASRGSRKSETLELNLDVQEKKLEWLFDQPPMEELQPINKTHYAKIVAGAASLNLTWAGEALAGLEVREIEGAKNTWQLTGTPASSGTFQAEFHATTKLGKEETKSFTIKVKPAPSPEPLVVPPPSPTTDQPKAPPPAPQTTTPSTEEQPTASEAAADHMRTFFLERIEKANNHFTDADKTLLRVIVGRLKEARLVTTVKFDVNQTNISPSQTAALKKALREPDTARLLENADCQLLVVGYASKTGSYARNVKLSQQRSQRVNEVLRNEINRKADLCGDYGPTDLVSSSEAGNRVVEIYAGTIEINKSEQIVADMFKKDFNRRHGGDR